MYKSYDAIYENHITKMKLYIEAKWRLYASVNWDIIGSNNNLSLYWCQDIIWNFAVDLLLIGNQFQRNLKIYNQNTSICFQKCISKFCMLNGDQFVHQCVKHNKIVRLYGRTYRKLAATSALEQTGKITYEFHPYKWYQPATAEAEMVQLVLDSHETLRRNGIYR